MYLCLEFERCGDGQVGEAEACDDGNRLDDDNGCSAQCTRIGECGNGTIESYFETCDDGNTVTDLCPDGETSCVVCTAECREGPGDARICGDGAVSPSTGEHCDDGNAINDGNGCQEDCTCDFGYRKTLDGCELVELAPCGGTATSEVEYEPNECPADAVELPIGTSLYPSLAGSSDIDWFKFNAEAGHIYYIYAYETSNVDIEIALYDVDGVTQLQSRDPASSLRSSLTIVREFETSGTYFIRVRYDTGTSTGDYRLRLQTRVLTIPVIHSTPQRLFPQTTFPCQGVSRLQATRLV